MPTIIVFILTISLIEKSALAKDTCLKPFTPHQESLPVSPRPNAIILFEGKDTNAFHSMVGGRTDWPIVNGALVSTPNGRRSNNIVSRLHFRDADIHVEFMLPQTGDGNSGIYLHGLYEIQILDSIGKQQPGMGDMGSIYGLSKPKVNATLPRGKWQVLDIRFYSPRRDTQGRINKLGTLTAWLNGHKVQDAARIGETESKYNPYRYDSTTCIREIWRNQQRSMTGPLILQDHDNAVHFRNIWVVPLDDCNFTYLSLKDQPRTDSRSDRAD